MTRATYISLPLRRLCRLGTTLASICENHARWGDVPYHYTVPHCNNCIVCTKFCDVSVLVLRIVLIIITIYDAARYLQIDANTMPKLGVYSGHVGKSRQVWSCFSGITLAMYMV